MTDENFKLREEMRPLKEIIISARRHFKSIESSNFDSLQKQLQDYQEKLDSLGISAEKMSKHKAKMATMKMNEGQIENDTK